MASTTKISFTSQVEFIGDRALVRLPKDASAALASRGQVAAEITLKDKKFTTVLEPDGRKGHWISLSDELISDLSVSEGSTVDGAISPTKDWPEPEIPSDWSAALSEAPEASSVYRDTTAMARWEWVRWIGATKNADTRARRVEVGISKLSSGKRRPCCFDLASCTDPDLSTSGKLIAPQ